MHPSSERMLYLLGLVRRPEEPVPILNEVMKVNVNECPSKSDKEAVKLIEAADSIKNIITVEMSENCSGSKNAVSEEDEIEDNNVISVETSDANNTTTEGGKQGQCEKLHKADEDSVIKASESVDVTEEINESVQYEKLNKVV